MSTYVRWLALVLALVTVSCKTSRLGGRAGKDDGKLELVFVQVNDVYEIAPLGGGKYGGMARVATLKKQYLSANPNTFLVIAGDFVSPSVYNSLQYHGKRIRGRQMIEAMNAAGMDLAVFGNHEFDITENELQERINESQFRWISTNSFHLINGKTLPFEKTRDGFSTPLPQTYIMTLKDADGTTAKIGFLGLTLPFNKPGYVSYTDPFSSARDAYARLKDSCDAVVAITHQAVEDDSILARQLPDLAVILGGHEHDMRFKKVGNVYITKAHANARSAYVVKLEIDKQKHTHTAIPELKFLDETVALDSATNKTVRKWMDIGDSSYTALGFNAAQVLIAGGDTLDGRETEIRSRSTNFTQLVTAAMADACPNADVVIFNAGSIRVDDMLAPPITQYDILRGLPFGGGIREGQITGSLLIQVLNVGRKNQGSGGFLQYQPVIWDANSQSWNLHGERLQPSKMYKVALSEFIATGKEANLGFLSETNPGLKLAPADTSAKSSRSDIRLAIVNYLQKLHH